MLPDPEFFGQHKGLSLECIIPNECYLRPTLWRRVQHRLVDLPRRVVPSGSESARTPRHLPTRARAPGHFSISAKAPPGSTNPGQALHPQRAQRASTLNFAPHQQSGARAEPLKPEPPKNSLSVASPLRRNHQESSAITLYKGNRTCLSIKHLRFCQPRPSSFVKMYFKALVILSLLLIVQAKYERGFTTRAKHCMDEIKTDEDTIRGKLTKKGTVHDDDEIMKKFTVCCLHDVITEGNEVHLDDKFTTYMNDVFTTRLEGREKLGKLLVRECTEHCKHIKGATREESAIKLFNCMMDHLAEHIDKEH